MSDTLNGHRYTRHAAARADRRGSAAKVVGFLSKPAANSAQPRIVLLAVPEVLMYVPAVAMVLPERVGHDSSRRALS